MRRSTEEFLYMLLWSSESLFHPSWRNLNDCFEDWAWRRGLAGRLAQLERQKLLEKAPGFAALLFVRLTEAGRCAALGGVDPVARWNRPWDGRWRMVLFDVPRVQHGVRMRLLRHLRARRYGYLQNSVWISPDPLGEDRELLCNPESDAEATLLLEGVPCGGESAARIVAGAWNFPAINRVYKQCIRLAEGRPARGTKSREAWAITERSAWKEVLRIDPLLPRPLLPPDYLGEKAWARRMDRIDGGQ